MTAIDKLNSEFNRIFDLFNNQYFKGELEKPIIITQTNGKDKLSMGWCTTKKVWKDNARDEYYYEITICAEYLYRNIPEICATLLHEMVHLYNLQKNIKDTSRGNTYHNKKFKQSAEAAGLVIEYDKRIGWSVTKLPDSTKEFIEANVNPEVFTLTRARHRNINPTGENEEGPEGEDTEEGTGDGEEEKPKHSTRKYICPGCNTIIRATKDVNVTCTDCNIPFVKQEN